MFPLIVPVQGTGLEGRQNRVEKLQVGEKVILKKYTHKVETEWREKKITDIEIFNKKNESLGIIADTFEVPVIKLIEWIDKIEAEVCSLVPASKRKRNTTFALMELKLELKK